MFYFPNIKIKKPLIAVLFGTVLLLAACKKKDVNPVQGFVPSQYFLPLASGNYWAYERTDAGSPGVIKKDSIKVVSDTVVNAITYYQIMGGYFEGIEDGYYRDSAGFIIYYINPGGPGMASWIYKLTNHRNDTLLIKADGPVNIVQQTGNPDTTIQVAAGSFNSLQVINSVYYTASYPPPSGVSNPRLSYLYFSKGVGVTFATTFFADSPTTISSQLVGYHIAP